MKKCMLILMSVSCLWTHAQTDSASKTVSAGVLNIDTRGLEMDATSAGNLVRLELEKLNVYDVIDRYDVADLYNRQKFTLAGCYGKSCVVEAGNLLNANKMITGTIERLGEKIVVSFRLIDVKAARVEASSVKEYLFIPERVQEMVRISLQELLKLLIDKDLEKKLMQTEVLENAQNNPRYDRLQLDGPRFGATMLTGDIATIFSQPIDKGGFDCYPVMFQFGYQFEVQYLNEGRFQGLFEFIPVINGLDQGKFIPSIGILNGFRDNKHGWELAFGPSIYLTQMAKGYYVDGEWHIESDWTDTLPNPHSISRRLDSRGVATITSGFVVGLGKTFRSGRLNMPVNLFMVTSKHGMRYGISMGFNVKNRREETPYRRF
jgi:hypothetical protein